MSRPLILVTNDDGVHAPGLRALVDAVTDFGDVTVCAPETERSGASHAITLHSHLRINPVRENWWSVNGTPVDCVYLGVLHLLPGEPDLVLSGINPGYNLGTDVFYSGTVGAAAEAYIRGTSAMAVSVGRNTDPRAAMPAVRTLVELLLTDETIHLFNVNVGHLDRAGVDPDPEGHDRPIEITRLGQRPYLDRVEKREDPQGRPYYWIGGPPAPVPRREGEDTWAVSQGVVSVTPLELDITAGSLEPARQLLRRRLVRIEQSHARRASGSDSSDE